MPVGWPKGRRLSEEHKRKLSLAKKGKTHEEIFGREGAEKRKKQVREQGYKNKGRKRPDLLLRNLLNNPMASKSAQKKSSKAHTKTGEWLYDNPKVRDIICSEGCRGCGRVEGMLHIHHIDGNRLNNEMKNLVCLCPSCHKIIHNLEKE